MRSESDGTMSDPGSKLTEGTRVQVRNQFDGAWARGFEVHRSGRNGYVVRRLSDRSVLPATFAPPDLRRETPVA